MRVADIQDLGAALYHLAWQKRFNEFTPWFNLFLTSVGLIPTVGSAIKAVAKYLRATGGSAYEGASYTYIGGESSIELKEVNAFIASLEEFLKSIQQNTLEGTNLNDPE